MLPFLGVTNAEFLCGKAEDVLPKCLEKPFSFGGHEVVGVVDPPRNGLRKYDSNKHSYYYIMFVFAS